MESRRKIIVCLILLIVSFLFLEVSAQCMIDWSKPGPSGSQWGSFDDVQNSLKYIGAVLAVLFMVLNGIKWIIADGPEDREDAKKGIIYTIIGLILLGAAYQFIYYLMC